MKQEIIHIFYHDMKQGGMFFGAFITKEACNKFLVDKYYQELCASNPELDIDKEKFVDVLCEQVIKTPWIKDIDSSAVTTCLLDCDLTLEENMNLEDIKDIWVLMQGDDDFEAAIPVQAFISKEEAIKGVVAQVHKEFDNEYFKRYETEQEYVDYAEYLVNMNENPLHAEYDTDFDEWTHNEYYYSLAIVRIPLIID